MISLQTDNLTYLFLEIKHEIHHTPGIGSPVYIISNEYEGIVFAVDPDSGNDPFQFGKTAMNIAYREYFPHTIPIVRTGRLQTPRS